MHLSRVGSTLTGNMKARLAATKRVLAEAGVRAAEALPVLSHSDAAGTRPDVMVASAAHVHPSVLRYLAAHHGLLHGMPNVVAFNAHPSGPDKVHILHSGLDQAAVFDVMRRAGLPRFSVHKNVVYVFDRGASYDLSHLLGPLNASQYHSVSGHGRVVGAREGADAAGQRAAYRDAVRAAEAHAAGAGAAAGGAGGAVGAQGADPAGVKLSRRVKAPDATLAYGGAWKLPAASLDALHAHATGIAPLSDAEVVSHLTNHPHPVAGRIASLPTTRVSVDVRRPGYTPESIGATGAMSLLRGGGHVSDEQVRQGFYGNLPETKAAKPGELMHSGEGSDFLLHHAPSDTWLSVNIDHDLGPGGVTAEHAAQYRRASQSLVRPILKRFLKHGGGG